MSEWILCRTYDLDGPAVSLAGQRAEVNSILSTLVSSPVQFALSIRASLNFTCATDSGFGIVDAMARRPSSPFEDYGGAGQRSPSCCWPHWAQSPPSRAAADSPFPAAPAKPTPSPSPEPAAPNSNTPPCNSP